VLKQIEAFFTNYQKVRDIEYEILDRGGSRVAQQLVNQATEEAA
jgi:hypothetical protein